MAISVVQTQSNSGTTTPISVTITSTVAQNTLIVCVGNNGNNNPPASVVTSGGQSLTLAAQSLDANNANGTIWYLDNAPGGQTSVTASWSGAASHVGVVVYEVSGVYAVAGSFDQTNSGFLASGSPTAWSSGATPTLSQASEIAIGCSAQIGISLVITGPSSPWTNTTAAPSGGGVIAGQKIVAATTAVTYNGSSTHAGTEQSATLVATFKAGTPPAGGGPAGTVQPEATVPVPRRRPRRALWQRITGQGVAQVPAPGQQPGPAPRRRRARAWVKFTPVTTTNAVPPNGTVQPSAARPAPRRKIARALVRFTPVATSNAVPVPPVSGTVQPEATVPVPRRARLRAVARGLLVPGVRGAAPAQEYQAPPRRRRARASVQFVPVATTNAPPNIQGTVQPQTAQPAPRRRRLRALVRFTPVATTNAHGGAGTVQRRPTVPVPRRRRQRAISGGIAAPFLPFRVAAPRQEYRTPARRRRARALVQFVPVVTTNAIGPQTLIISLAAEAGVDDYGNHFPQGILVNQGVIEGNVISSQSIPKGTLATGAVDDFTINAATINAGTITAADILISGVAGGQFAYSSGGTITQIFTSSGAWIIPAGVTSYVLEGWAGGGGGGGTNGALDAGAGGGGAEYVKYNSVSGTPGATVNFTVGAAGFGNSGTGPGTSGGSGIWDTGGSPKTVHGGKGGGGAGSFFAIGGAAGTGNTDADVHHDGGAGAGTNPSSLAGGGGGSGGSATTGVTPPFGSDFGAPAVADGGPGGDGDSSPVTGPGGGGGGFESFSGGDGQPGQWKVTYTSNSPQLIASIAGAVTTDPVAGGAVPEGVASDHFSVTSTGSTPATPSGLCVLYYDGTHLKAVGPSGVAVTIATT